MSRLPPEIKQHINGEKVEGWSIVPIEDHGITYHLDSSHRQDESGSIIGMDWMCEAVDSAGVSLWKITYFPQEFVLGLETDVQESYPIDFRFEGDTINVEHEWQDKLFCIRKNGTLVTE